MDPCVVLIKYLVSLMFFRVKCSPDDQHAPGPLLNRVTVTAEDSVDLCSAFG